MPKSDRKYVKSTLSSPYKRSPLLPITLTGDLTKSEIENDDVDKKKMKSKVLTPSRFDKVTPKKEKREKAARKPSKFWSKEEELELLRAQLRHSIEKMQTLYNYTGKIDRNKTQINMKFKCMMDTFEKQYGGGKRH